MWSLEREILCFRKSFWPFFFKKERGSDFKLVRTYKSNGDSKAHFPHLRETTLQGNKQLQEIQVSLNEAAGCLLSTAGMMA